MKTRYLLLLPMLTLGVVACQGRNRGAATQKAVEVLHKASSCPKLVEGHYTADNMKEKYIEVFDNRETREQELNFNGIELVPINGKPTNQKNGSKITAACVNDAVRIVARDMKGGVIETVVKLAKDGGLQVEQRSPKSPAVHYSAAGALRTSVEKFKEMLTPESTKETKTAIPQAASPVAPATSTPEAGSPPPNPEPSSNRTVEQPISK